MSHLPRLSAWLAVRVEAPFHVMIDVRSILVDVILCAVAQRANSIDSSIHSAGFRCSTECDANRLGRGTEWTRNGVLQYAGCSGSAVCQETSSITMSLGESLCIALNDLHCEAPAVVVVLVVLS